LGRKVERRFGRPESGPTGYRHYGQQWEPHGAASGRNIRRQARSWRQSGRWRRVAEGWWRQRRRIGTDPKVRYDSAIQITGNSRKVQQEAEAKESEVRDQEGVAHEGDAKVDAALQNAKSSATKFSQLAEQAEDHASAASEAAILSS
jgi:hypothetical protein